MAAGQPRGAGDNVPPVSVRVADGVATITMAAPALTADAKRSLVEAIPAVGADDSVRAIVLTGTGRVFCAGQDLGEHAEALRADPGTAFQTIADHYNPIVSALAAAPKPVLAAINGTCAGAGLSLALACDVRICAAEAKFSTAFTGIGLAPDSGLSATLARAVGAARASELILLSERFPAADALAWGLVGRLVPAAVYALVFSVVNGLVLRPLPGGRPGRRWPTPRPSTRWPGPGGCRWGRFFRVSRGTRRGWG